MHQNYVLYLYRAHSPSGGDDHVVGSATVVEVAIFIGTAQVLCGHPLATAQHHQLAGRARGTDFALGVVDLDHRAWHGFAQRTALDGEVFCSGVACQHHSDLCGAVHTAYRQTKRLLHEVGRVVVDGLTGEGQLLEVVVVVTRFAAVLHHAVVGSGRRHIGEAMRR
ncbi:hypothetical protein D3C71_1065510 [compost metagenome]